MPAFDCLFQKLKKVKKKGKKGTKGRLKEHPFFLMWPEGETEQKRLIELRRVAHAAELVEWEAARVIVRDTRGMKMPKKPLLALGELLKAKKKPNASANADPEEVENEQPQHEKEYEAQRDFGSGEEEDLSSDSDNNNNNSNGP